MIRISPLLSVLVCVVLLTGCSAPARNFSDAHPQMVASPDSVSAMLAEAADRASLSLEKLAAVEYSRAPNASIAPAGDAPAELKRAVTVNWVGPVEPIAKTMAERAGYNFLPIGSPPPVPVVVSIDAENRPVIDVLRDIGLQLGVRGDVKVDSSQRIVELHYPPTTGVGVDQ
jgi:defect in organelle trafficking protein DotD